MNFTKYLIVFSLVRRQNSQRHLPLAWAGLDDEIENRQLTRLGAVAVDVVRRAADFATEVLI